MAERSRWWEAVDWLLAFITGAGATLAVLGWGGWLSWQQRPSAPPARAAQVFDVPESEVRFVGSSRSMIYHRPECRHGKKIGPDSRMAFRSAEEAVKAGYRACGVCRP